MKGTMSAVGTCGLTKHIMLNRGFDGYGWPVTQEMKKLHNGPCYYLTPHETGYLRISN